MYLFSHYAWKVEQCCSRALYNSHSDDIQKGFENLAIFPCLEWGWWVSLCKIFSCKILFRMIFLDAYYLFIVLAFYNVNCPELVGVGHLKKIYVNKQTNKNIFFQRDGQNSGKWSVLCQLWNRAIFLVIFILVVRPTHSAIHDISSIFHPGYKIGVLKFSPRNWLLGPFLVKDLHFLRKYTHDSYFTRTVAVSDFPHYVYADFISQFACLSSYKLGCVIYMKFSILVCIF